MPTKPETHIVSPSRTMAIASSADTILFLSVIGLLPLGKPFGDSGAEQGLRLAADEYADMSTRQWQLAVVLSPHFCSEGLRRGGRNDVVVLGKHVEHGHRNVAQVHLPPTDHEGVVDEPVALIELLEPLLGGLA